jgi:VWFA-related protein
VVLPQFTRVIGTPILAAAGLIVSAHAQQPVFRTSAIHVRVDVIATDKKDQPVTNLKADDFEITQNGVQQAIADFEYVSIPTIDRKIDLNAPQPPPPDSFTNAPPPPSARAFVFLMWSLRPENIIPIKRMMTSFVSALQPDDEVAIVYGTRSDISQDFTNNATKLVRAINNLRGGMGGPPFRDWLFSMHNVMQSLKSAREPRKVIVFVSEGFPIRFPMPPEILEIFREAVRLNIPIYTMDPRGLMAPPLGLDRHIEDQVADGLERIRGMQKSTEGMQIIAENTNGRAFVNNWNVPQSAAALIGENNSYYLLGFYPNPYAADGKFHDIDVKVKRAGVKIRARMGYTSEAPPAANAKPPQLIDNLGAAMPGGDLILHATAAPLAASPKGASTLLTIDVDYPASASGRDQLDLVWMAIDPDGHPRASGQNSMNVDLSGRSPHVTIHDAIDLPRGQLTVRVAVASRVMRTNGSVHLPIQVRDLSKNRVEVSALLVGLQPAPPAQLVELGGGLGMTPVTPTTARTFAQTDRLRVLARVFSPKGANSSCDLTLTMPGGEVRAIPTDRSDAKRIPGASDFLGEIVLNDLPAGQYVLTFSARSPAAKDKPAVRTMTFEVK